MRLETDEPDQDTDLAPETVPVQSRRRSLRYPPVRPRVARVREAAAELFVPVRRRPITWLTVLGVGAGMLVMVAYSLLRVAGPGAFNTIWAEDASNFLTDAYMEPVQETLFKPLNGYFVVLSRIIAEVASQFPVLWGPGVLSTLAALFSAGTGVMVYVASGHILGRPFLRAAAAVWIVAAPLAESRLSFGPNMVAPLQFVELYGLFWALVWTPTRKLARAVQVIFIVLCCLSTFLTVPFLLLAALRVWAVRSRWSVLLLTLMTAGAAFQALGLIMGISSRRGISHPRPDPLWALLSYVDWTLPYGMVGERTMSDPDYTIPGAHTGTGGPWYWFGVTVSWLVVAAAVVVAARRMTRPYWLFAGVALVESVLLSCGQVIVQGRLELRYAYTPALIAVAGLLALLRPRLLSRHRLRSEWIGTWIPAVALVSLLTLSATVNYRLITPRTAAIPWTVLVEQSTGACRTDRTLPFVINTTIGGWFVVVPCYRLR